MLKRRNSRKNWKKHALSMKADFLSYDSVQGIWKFRVHHFSRYGLFDDDSDDEEPAVTTNANDAAQRLPDFAGKGAWRMLPGFGEECKSNQICGSAG
jgi:hypothetical protein